MENERKQPLKIYRLALVNFMKMFLNVSFVVLILGTVGVAAFSVYFIRQLSVMNDALPVDLFEALKTGGSINLGIARLNSLDELNMPTLNGFILNILNSYGIETIIAVSIAKLITDEYRYNGIAMYISKGFKRNDVFLSYVIIAIFHTLILSCVYVAAFALGFAIAGMDTKLDFKAVFDVLIAQEFMLISFSIMTVTLSIILKKPVKTILFIFSVVFVLPTAMIYVRMLYGIDVTFEKYWLLTRLYNVGTYMPSIYDYLSAAALITASVIAGCVAMKKMRFSNI
jgi:hypothetical protein